jgi:hypothetical protein
MQRGLLLAVAVLALHALSGAVALECQSLLLKTPPGFD